MRHAIRSTNEQQKVKQTAMLVSKFQCMTADSFLRCVFQLPMVKSEAYEMNSLRVEAYHVSP